jgi:hydrogenase nickel incorporation protein HypA/HybF
MFTPHLRLTPSVCSTRVANLRSGIVKGSGDKVLMLENDAPETSMHEISIMAEALRIAVQAARSAGAKRVTGIKLRVGTLSGAVPDAMRFAWDVVRHGTIAEAAVLEIELVSAAGWCPKCQTGFECDPSLFECPRCHELSGELRRGRELDIIAVETE